MSLQLSDYTEALVIDRFLRNQAFSPPAAVYLALYSSPTGDDGSGTEATGGSYARKAITLTAAAGGVSSNSAAIQYTGMPAGTWTHVAILDASSGGNMLWHGALPLSKTTSAGQTMTIAIGDLVIGFTSSSAATDYLRNKIIDHTLRGQAFTPPTNLYQSLYSTATDTSGGGTELSGSGYARVGITLTAPSGGTSSADSAITITSPAATVTHAAVMDALTSGNMLLQGALASAITALAGDSIQFPLGSISVVVQ